VTRRATAPEESTIVQLWLYANHHFMAILLRTGASVPDPPESGSPARAGKCALSRQAVDPSTASQEQPERSATPTQRRRSASEESARMTGQQRPSKSSSYTASKLKVPITNIQPGRPKANVPHWTEQRINRAPTIPVSAASRFRAARGPALSTGVQRTWTGLRRADYAVSSNS